MTIHIPDISEFQPNADWARVNKWNGGHAIVRAAYGTSHTDHAWGGGARRASFWKNGGKTLGIYQYLVAGQSAAAQAKALHKIVGSLKPGEYLVCDLEEGSGNQHSRWVQWHDTLVGLGVPSSHLWLYSGEYFTKDHGLLPVANSATHTWIAAYQSHAPSVPHSLWQYTSGASVPGIPGRVDCSVYDGSQAQWMTLVLGSKPSPAPKPKPHPAPVISHPFAKLRLDGDLGPITAHALNYWLHVPNKQNQVCARTIRALQHMVGAGVDGQWGKNNCAIHDATCHSDTTTHLQEFLRHHGSPKLAVDGRLGSTTIKALQKALNVYVGHYA